MSLLATASCDENALDAVCDARCRTKASKTATRQSRAPVAVDSFFRSVVNFKGVAASVSADIQAELDGIQGSFGINAADMAKANGKLGAAIKTKLSGDFQAKLVVKAQPAKCGIDAKSRPR